MIFGAVDVPLLHFYPAKVLFQDVIMGLSPDKDIFVQKTMAHDYNTCVF